ncbi:phage integrase SAM-like domain protein [Striga asiatica]|uniref:Phage integrase SAM-like domain protein n=1 Tax=Striga asiatica TaxID=4170 RepID=A0A5A7QMJ4_STRAF|nr:phage integrase SAM-like domain protein [Striga asiatica]
MRVESPNRYRRMVPERRTKVRLWSGTSYSREAISEGPSLRKRRAKEKERGAAYDRGLKNELEHAKKGAALHRPKNQISAPLTGGLLLTLAGQPSRANLVAPLPAPFLCPLPLSSGIPFSPLAALWKRPKGHRQIYAISLYLSRDHHPNHSSREQHRKKQRGLVSLSVLRIEKSIGPPIIEQRKRRDEVPVVSTAPFLFWMRELGEDYLYISLFSEVLFRAALVPMWSERKKGEGLNIYALLINERTAPKRAPCSKQRTIEGLIRPGESCKQTSTDKTDDRRNNGQYQTRRRKRGVTPGKARKRKSLLTTRISRRDMTRGMDFESDF